jgi:hypothetical protein
VLIKVLVKKFKNDNVISVKMDSKSIFLEFLILRPTVSDPFEKGK